MNNSGIYGLAGYAYQIKVFIYYLAKMQNGYELGYETYDDVALQKNDVDSDVQERKLQTYNGMFDTPSGLTALQVKRTTLSKDDYEKVLFNWIILKSSQEKVEKFVLLVDKSYGNVDSVFSSDLQSLYNKIVNSTSGGNALITKVKNIVNGDYALFSQICSDIKDKYSFEEIDSIDDAIFEGYKLIFNHGGVKDVVYQMRIRDLVEKITQELLVGISRNQSYKCDYTTFKMFVEDTNSRIKDDLYLPPDFSEFREGCGIDMANAAIFESRQYKQLKKCGISEFLIKEELIFEEYYNSYKLRCLENLKSNSVENIEYTTYYNFEITKSYLQANNIDTPNNRLHKTQEKENSYAHNEQIRSGSAIHLTKVDTNPAMLISWEDETE